MLLRIRQNCKLGGRLVAANRLSKNNDSGIKWLSIFRVPKLSSMTAHMLAGKAVSLAPTTKEVCEQGGRSGNSKTLNLVTHFHRRLTILETSQG